MLGPGSNNLWSMANKTNLLITGGAGFIGSHLVRRLVNRYPEYNIYNLDLLTYAGNLENLKDVAQQPNYTFIKGDIRDEALVDQIFESHQINGVIHLAAESHVDRSISNPMDFVTTNVIGTVVLLNAARKYWKGTDNKFYHISTDEVFGSVKEPDLFHETTPYQPKSPYSASKASSDHFVRAYHNTYGLHTMVSNCSNNYGPGQFPEKLIPLCINNIKGNLPLPVYGQGTNVRDWLYVGDHVDAIDLLYHQGVAGETYNIGGDNQWQNIALVKLLCDIMDERLGKSVGTSQELITMVKDRPGHDQRYAMDISKISQSFGWAPKTDLAAGLALTVDWYLQNERWLHHVTSGEYLNYYEQQYANR